MYNMVVSPKHVEGMPVRWGVQGCIAPPKFPNLQKKSPKLLFASKASLKNWEFYVFFGQRNSLKFRKGSSFVRFAPPEAKKKKKKKKKTPEFLQKCPHSENQEEIHF